MARAAPPARSTSSNSARASRSIRSVSASTYQLPPAGSTTSGTPVSCARICWVRSASVALCAVGSANASSYALVCSDCVPPSTAASAWIATRTTLFCGCCAVRVEPPVWVWNRSRQAASPAPNCSFIRRAHSRRAARNLATSSNRSGNALLFPDHDVHREQHRRGGVDGHRGGHPVERDALGQARQIVHRVDRHPRAAHLPLGHGMIGVVPHLRGEIERHREPRLTGGEEMTEPRVGLFGGAEPGVLPHGPQLAAVHRGVHTARERECPRRPEVARVLPPPVLRAVYRLAVAHVGTPAAAMISTASSTSALLPT